MGRPKKQYNSAETGKRALILLRVSGKKQVEEGNGLEMQEDACYAYTASKGYIVVCAPLKDEAVSGTKGVKERAGLEKALEMCRAGLVDVLVCYALDRSARDVGLFDYLRKELTKTGTRLETAKEGQDFTARDNLLMGDIYAAFAAEERRKIAARLYGGRRVRSKRDGLGSGPVPWGYTWEGSTGAVPAIDQAAAPAIRKLLELRGAGKTYQATADALNAAGYAAPKGGLWTTGNVQTVEKHKELYQTGIRQWDGVTAAERWPAIL